MFNFVRGFLLHLVYEVHIIRFSFPTIAIECINCINFTSHPWQPELLSPVKPPGEAAHEPPPTQSEEEDG